MIGLLASISIGKAELAVGLRCPNRFPRVLGFLHGLFFSLQFHSGLSALQDRRNSSNRESEEQSCQGTKVKRLPAGIRSFQSVDADEGLWMNPGSTR